MGTSIIKSVWAVIAGLIVLELLTNGMDSLVNTLSPFPGQTATAYPWWIVLISVIYRIVFGLVGGYITASIAPNRPMRHIAILVITEVILYVIVVAVTKPIFSAIGVFVFLALLSSLWLGGKLKVKNQKFNHPLIGN